MNARPFGLHGDGGYGGNLGYGSNNEKKSLETELLVIGHGGYRRYLNF